MITYNIITIDWVINILRELLDGVLKCEIIVELPGLVELPESLGKKKGDIEFIEEIIKRIKELIRNGGSKEEIIRLLKLLIRLLEELLGIKINIDIDKLFGDILGYIKSTDPESHWMWATAHIIIAMYGIYTIKRCTDLDHYPDLEEWPDEIREKKKEADKKKKEELEEYKKKKWDEPEDKVTMWDVETWGLK